MSEAPTRRNTDLRRRNSLDVLEALRRGGRMSRAALTDHTTLSTQGLASILNDLVKTGHVLEVDTQQAARGRGRPAILYEYNPHQFSVISLYIGLRYSELSICDGLGRPIAENVEFTPGWDVDRLVQESGDWIRTLRRRAKVDHIPCYIGVVVHGAVDAETGATDSRDMGWHAVPLAALLGEHVDAKVTVHDASRAAAIAESREGAAVGVRRAVVLNIGPELTATQIVDGVPDVGATGLAGMVGRARIWDHDTFKAVDDIAGSFAIRNRYTEISGERVDWMSDVSDRARRGDALAEEAVAQHLEAMAYVSMWLITITNPQRFVIGGFAGLFLEHWRARLHSRIVELTDSKILNDCTIRISDLGRQGWIRGGVHAVLDDPRTLEGPTSV